MPKQNDFTGAAKKAAERTDQKLEEESEGLPGATWETIRRMLPDPADQAGLDEMRRLVEEDTDHNEKVASLLKNIHSLAGVVVKVMERIQ